MNLRTVRKIRNLYREEREYINVIQWELAMLVFQSTRGEQWEKRQNATTFHALYYSRL